MLAEAHSTSRTFSLVALNRLRRTELDGAVC